MVGTDIFIYLCDEFHKRNDSARYSVVNTKLEVTEQIEVQ